ncbi:hypothetical protein NIES4075_04120 [Tolypothrix sp. NIES-4075]|uniref:hypothetical protein n=1 Tax=Tolypothrix sp. NIES-4075 TaxID=2005459 RepID=UPI000B6AF276|nr:hypothetical protein [Tolypothrix sp. NIES-4075]GAX39456.1 hypothetical protein NIES4075_04120 [Tolypothrix sp. NIES-4075]
MSIGHGAWDKETKRQGDKEEFIQFSMPITHHQLPIPHYPLPITNAHCPLSNLIVNIYR